MTNVVFFPRDGAFANQEGLRELARSVVRTHPLMQRCIAGDLIAFRLLLWGYWDFVDGFEKAIDRHPIPRSPLVQRFGREAFMKAFRTVAPKLNHLELQETYALNGGTVLQEMRDEERGHARQWLRDGLELGIDILHMRPARIPLVLALLEQTSTEDMCRFFTLLAATEFMAEEISGQTCASSAARALFIKRNNWGWGVIHITPHEDHPSHLEMDIDFARAYIPEEHASERIEHLIASGIRLFGAAASDVLAHEHELPAVSLLAAAE